MPLTVTTKKVSPFVVCTAMMPAAQLRVRSTGEQTKL
jgi:hypothetical protein